MVAYIELEKKLTRLDCTVTYDGPSSSLRKSFEHALTAHTYDMMSQIKSKLQCVRMSLVCDNLFYTVMRTTEAQIRLHGCAF